jgi:hypothetical protein
VKPARLLRQPKRLVKKQDQICGDLQISLLSPIACDVF